jgi:hypothetical protein
MKLFISLMMFGLLMVLSVDNANAVIKLPPPPPVELRPWDEALGNPPRGADKPLEADGVEVSMGHKFPCTAEIPACKVPEVSMGHKPYCDAEIPACKVPLEVSMGGKIDDFIEAWRNSTHHTPTLPHPPVDVSMGGPSNPAYFDRDNPGRKIIQPIPDPLCPKGNVCIQPLV